MKRGRDEPDHVVGSVGLVPGGRARAPAGLIQPRECVNEASQDPARHPDHDDAEAGGQPEVGDDQVELRRLRGRCRRCSGLLRCELHLLGERPQGQQRDHHRASQGQKPHRHQGGLCGFESPRLLRRLRRDGNGGRCGHHRVGGRAIGPRCALIGDLAVSVPGRCLLGLTMRPRGRVRRSPCPPWLSLTFRRWWQRR